MPSTPPARAPFLYLLTLLGVTLLYYSAITSREVSLSYEQLSAFERSVFTFSNTSVYTSTIGSDDKVLGRLSAEEWAKAAAGSVGVVALLYAPVHEVMAADADGGGAWMAAALAAMAVPPGGTPTSGAITDATAAALAPPPPPPPSAVGVDGRAAATATDTLRMALFPCGCVIPSAYFAAVDVRMGGRECTLLPGYVLPAPRVAWAAAAADALRPLAAACAASRAAASADVEGGGNGEGEVRWQTLVTEARRQLPAQVVEPPPEGGVVEGWVKGRSTTVGSGV
ncbi:hypothetical protein MMPV_006255 [Pyropia vietnamensis]